MTSSQNLSFPLAVKPNAGMMGFMFRRVDSMEQFPFHFTGIKADASKDNRPLLIRTERRGLERSLAIIAAAGDPSDVDQWIARAADALFDEVQAEPDIWRPILGLVQGAPAVVSQRIADTREVIRAYLAAGLETGVRLRGRPDLDPEVLSHVVLATAEEFGRLALESPPRYEKERLLATLEQLIGLLR